MKKRIAFAMCLVLLLTMAAHPFSGHAESAARPLANFNGDAFADLAVGVPGEAIGVVLNAGAVNVLYGATSSGLDDVNNQLWNQDSTDIVNAAEDNDQFGYALAMGDFDNDGYTDLAVGVPTEDDGLTNAPGAVHILYGTAAGLAATDNAFLGQSSLGILDDSEADDQFGYALAVGDFDGDGYDDLAVGVPYEDIGNPLIDGAGAVNILYGSATGLGGDNSFWHQDVTDVAGAAEDGDHFGFALTAADFDGDGYSDLAVGVSGEDIGIVVDAGGVNVLFGSALGLIASRNQFWSQDVAGVSDSAEASDGFGRALTAGDFDGDGYADLAVGVPYEDFGAIDNAGVVHVLSGSPSGPTAAIGDQLWHQDVGNIMDLAENNDYFGYVLTSGDFDGNGYADLGVGVPYEDTGGNINSGAVNVLYGSGSGLTDVGDQEWWQDALGISDSSEANDYFGRALAAGDFDGDGFDELAVGVPYEDIGSVVNAGMVHVLPGSAAGLVGPGGMDQMWHQDVGTVLGGPETDDLFGYALAALPHTMAQGSNIYLPLIIR